MQRSNLTLKGFYLMSFWYKRVEAQRRFSFFVNAATFAGGFGSLLATGIGYMDGIRGYHAWRWIFILEGLFTCLLSIGVHFIVSNFLESARWLDESERKFAIRRISEDQGEWDTMEKVGWQVFVGYGYVSIAISTWSYLVDAFDIYAASATAGTVILRNAAAAALPLAGPALIGEIGIGWAYFMLALLGLIAAPIPLVLLRTGARLRQLHPVL